MEKIQRKRWLAINKIAIIAVILLICVPLVSGKDKIKPKDIELTLDKGMAPLDSFEIKGSKFKIPVKFKEKNKFTKIGKEKIDNEGICIRTEGLPYDYYGTANNFENLSVRQQIFIKEPIKFDLVYYTCSDWEDIIFRLDPYVTNYYYSLGNFSSVTQLGDLDKNTTRAVYTASALNGVSYALHGQPRLSLLDDMWHNNRGLSDGLIFGWRGENNIDHVGGLTATNNGAKFSNGYIGKGGFFDGINDDLDYGDSASLDIGASDLTISVWIKKDQLGQNDYIIDKKQASGTLTGYGMLHTSSNTIYLNLGNGSQLLPSAGSIQINDYDWHHVVGVFDRDGKGEIYVDGVYDVGSDDISAFNGQNLDSNRDFCIGSYDVGGYFEGSIDEVYIWNRSLSSTEISKLYNEQKYLHGDNWNNETSFSEVVGAWDFTQYFNNTVYMNTSYSNLTNNLTCTECPTSYNAGAYFDGSNDRLRVPYDQQTALQVEYDDFMIEMWYTPTNTFETSYVFDRHKPSSPYFPGYGAYQQLNKLKVFASGNQTNSNSAVEANVQSNNTYYITYLFRPSEYAKLYVNGNFEDSAVPDPNTGNVSFTQSTYTLNLGSTVTGSSFYKGMIHNFKITKYGEAGELPENHTLFTDELVGYWKLNAFNATYGISDYSGYGNNGSIFGGVTFVDSVKNLKNASGFSSAGGSDYINITNASILNFNNTDFSVSVWAKQSSYNEVILDKRNTDWYSGKGYSLSAYGGTAYFEVGDGVSSDSNVACLADFYLNKWTHYVAVVDRDSQISFYINGNLCDTDTGITALEDIASNKTLKIGGYRGYTYDGLIDELMIFNRTLSAEEAYTLYERGIAGIPENIGDYINFTYNKQHRQINVTSVALDTAVNVTVYRANTTSLNHTGTLQISWDGGSTWDTPANYPAWSYVPLGSMSMMWRFYGEEGTILQNITIENYYGRTATTVLTPSDGYIELYSKEINLTCGYNSTAPWSNYSIFAYNNQTGLLTNVENGTLSTNETSITGNYTAAYNGYFTFWCEGTNVDNVFATSTNNTILINTYNPPNLTNIYPTNGSTTNESSITFLANVTDDLVIDTCLFYSNMSGVWSLEESFFINYSEFNFSSDKYNPFRGNYIWNLFCNDSRGDNNTNRNFTFTRIDPPIPYGQCKLRVDFDANVLYESETPCTLVEDLNTCTDYNITITNLGTSDIEEISLRFIGRSYYYVPFNYNKGNYLVEWCNSTTGTRRIIVEEDLGDNTMNIQDWFFVGQFIIFAFVLFINIFMLINFEKAKEKISWAHNFTSFAIIGVCYLIGRLIMLLELEIITATLFKIEHVLFMMYIPLFIVQILLMFGKTPSFVKEFRPKR